uniref:nipped-B-like protein isoform X3 n=1 Tax=Myxine glutinosa TaxID=7769 RepID=UPI00358E56D1
MRAERGDPFASALHPLPVQALAGTAVMNGEMPHVPITTLAGIASLTDLLSELPLPSPLPATTTKSLLFSPRISDDATRLLSLREEGLVSQLCHALSQVSTDHIELKESLGSEEPEGALPALLQAVLSRSPNVFKEKSLHSLYGGISSRTQMVSSPYVSSSQGRMHSPNILQASPSASNALSHSHSQGLISQPLVPGSGAGPGAPYKLGPNSAGSNYSQPPSLPGSPARYLGVSGSARYLPQQTSPAPSPYTPQSPGFTPYSTSHPPAYSSSTQHALQHGPGDGGRVADGPGASQLCSLAAEDAAIGQGPTPYSAHTPQSQSPMASPDAASKPPTLPPLPSPHPAPPDILLDSPIARSKRKSKVRLGTGSESGEVHEVPAGDMEPEEARTSMVGELGESRRSSDEPSDVYNIVTTPVEDSNKLSLNLRVKSRDGSTGSDGEEEVSETHKDADGVPYEEAEEGDGVGEGREGRRRKGVSETHRDADGVPYEEAELEAMAEIERIEREAALERERVSKEVQDKDKPLKKRKQDSYPSASGPSPAPLAPVAAPTTPVTTSKVQVTKPVCPLLVSIDLEQRQTTRIPACEPNTNRICPTTHSPLPKLCAEVRLHPLRLPLEGGDHITKSHRVQEDCSNVPRTLANVHLASQCDVLTKTVGKENFGKIGTSRAGPVKEEPRREGFRRQFGKSVERVGGKGYFSGIRIPREVKVSEPVVVLHKLPMDKTSHVVDKDRERDRGRDRPGSSGKIGWRPGNEVFDRSILSELPPDLLAEIESTLPLCERVKINARKRSCTLSRSPSRAGSHSRPSYAESSSPDSEGYDVPRKKIKKEDRRERERERERERDRERVRRSFGEGRRMLGGRSRSEREPSLEEDSPPSPSEIARKRQKERERLKKKKMYEPKLTTQELMETPTFRRFNRSLVEIFENLEDMDISAAMADDGEIPQEFLLSKHQLAELASESAKLKSMGVISRISTHRLVKLLNVLEKNIRDGASLATLLHQSQNSEREERLWRELILERVGRAADAATTALLVLTAPGTTSALIIDDVIDRAILFVKFHLVNSLYPEYDPVYRAGLEESVGPCPSTSRSRRSRPQGPRPRAMLLLYQRLCQLVSLLAELLQQQLLPDTTILQVSSMGITPFFVENVSELQLAAIKMVTTVFSRYEKHRQLILEDIFASLVRLPTSKRSLRNYRLSGLDSDGCPVHIQMVSALVLQLIQCVVRLPLSDGNSDAKIDAGVFITNSYEMAMRTAQNFLSVFLKKCGSRQGEEDYRPLFENFVHDLLSTVNRPEWPASELLLSLLGRLLVHQFSNKACEMPLRVASLDYLGTVASRLRRDSVGLSLQSQIDSIISQLTEGQSGDEENVAENKPIVKETDDVMQLQKALLDFLEDSESGDAALSFARKFYIAQWYRDSTVEAEKATKSGVGRAAGGAGVDSSAAGASERSHAEELRSGVVALETAEKRKQFLLSLARASPAPYMSLRRGHVVQYDDAATIVKFLASMRPFAQSFDIYLTQILRVLGESSIAVRTKAMKCLSEVVSVDPSILARADMQRGVHGRLLDNATSVREAAVDLLGRSVLSRPILTAQYLDMLLERILDTGISVRKRVIKILRDICLDQPECPRITEMCVKMIRRVNDEEGIKKLVNETFQKLWFSPGPGHDSAGMIRKVQNITDVVSACKDTGFDWFEQLLQNLLKLEEDSTSRPVRKACSQIINCLVDSMLKYDEGLDSLGSSARLVSCLTTLHLFSKLLPRLIVPHALTLQPYLSTKCSTQGDFLVICSVARILELVVPLMDHPSESFLNTIEEDLMKLILRYGMTVVQNCVSCLGAVVNKVTHNYMFVWSCFNRYYNVLVKLRAQHREAADSDVLVSNRPTLLRALFTVGALCRHFDFDKEDFKGNTKVIIRERVLETLMYFTRYPDDEVQMKALIGLGYCFMQHPVLMFEPDVKGFYNGILQAPDAQQSNTGPQQLIPSSALLQNQVLRNLQSYLQAEDSRMQEADRDWEKVSKQEDLKEMGDVTSGMSSSIMQLYLKNVLESFFSSHSVVRCSALNVVWLTLNQGLVHPVQCVPYLIAMGTDPEPVTRNKADQQLGDIDRKYPGFVHMKAVAGVKMAFQLQCSILRGEKTGENMRSETLMRISCVE